MKIKIIRMKIGETLEDFQQRVNDWLVNENKIIKTDVNLLDNRLFIVYHYN